MHDRNCSAPRPPLIAILLVRCWALRPLANLIFFVIKCGPPPLKHIVRARREQPCFVQSCRCHNRGQLQPCCWLSLRQPSSGSLSRPARRQPLFDREMWQKISLLAPRARPHPGGPNNSLASLDPVFCHRIPAFPPNASRDEVLHFYNKQCTATQARWPSEPHGYMVCIYFCEYLCNSNSNNLCLLGYNWIDN